MQRFCSRSLRPFAAAAAAMAAGPISSMPRRSLSCSPFLSQLRRPSPPPTFAGSAPFRHLPFFPLTTRDHPVASGCRRPSNFPLQMVQKRDYATKERSRAPATPVTSKVKKYKIKGYASFKSRFRNLNDGTIRRWRAGKRHNAHLKSKKSKRRLRKPEIVPLAYAKVMKKLHFCA